MHKNAEVQMEGFCYSFSFFFNAIFSDFSFSFSAAAKQKSQREILLFVF